MTPDLLTQLSELAALMAEARALATPYDAQIRSVEIAKADALAALTFQIETLQATLRPMILAEGHTCKVDGLTAIVTQRQAWDTEGLLAMAQEIPAVLQFHRESASVSFRLNASRGNTSEMVSRAAPPTEQPT